MNLISSGAAAGGGGEGGGRAAIIGTWAPVWFCKIVYDHVQEVAGLNVKGIT